MEPPRMTAKQLPIATWYLSLETRCPACDKHVDLLDYSDFWDGRSDMKAVEHGTPRTDAMEVVCPECGHEFVVKCQY